MESRLRLTDFLDSHQRWTMTMYQFFEVRGSRGGLYQIHIGSCVQNIVRMSDGSTWCSHIPFIETEEDVELNFITQYLMLKCDELGFYEVANSDDVEDDDYVGDDDDDD